VSICVAFGRAALSFVLKEKRKRKKEEKKQKQNKNRCDEHGSLFFEESAATE